MKLLAALSTILLFVSTALSEEIKVTYQEIDNNKPNSGEEKAIKWTYEPGDSERAVKWTYEPGDSEQAVKWTYEPGYSERAVKWTYEPSGDETEVEWTYQPVGSEREIEWTYTPSAREMNESPGFEHIQIINNSREGVEAKFINQNGEDATVVYNPLTRQVQTFEAGN